MRVSGFWGRNWFGRRGRAGGRGRGGSGCRSGRRRGYRRVVGDGDGGGIRTVLTEGVGIAGHQLVGAGYQTNNQIIIAAGVAAGTTGKNGVAVDFNSQPGGASAADSLGANGGMIAVGGLIDGGSGGRGGPEHS